MRQGYGGRRGEGGEMKEEEGGREWGSLTYHIHYRNFQPVGNIAEPVANYLAMKKKIQVMY